MLVSNQTHHTSHYDECEMFMRFIRIKINIEIENIKAITWLHQLYRKYPCKTSTFAHSYNIALKGLNLSLTSDNAFIQISELNSAISSVTIKYYGFFYGTALLGCVLLILCSIREPKLGSWYRSLKLLLHDQMLGQLEHISSIYHFVAPPCMR